VGGVECWGANGEGELGNGTHADSVVPVPVSGLSQVTEIVLGYQHACALVARGAVYCWGQDAMGQLGDGAGGTGVGFTLNSDIPIQVGTPT
jgi:alpha-tubulin suppressor-like RCC1 family protein